MKPKCKLLGEDGNVFVIIGLVSRALEKAKLRDQVVEFRTKALASGSYDEVLQLCMEYVEVQ